MAEDTEIAVVAYQDGGAWQLAEVSVAVAENLDLLATALRRFPAEGAAVALVALGEDDFVIARAAGDDVTRLFLSDVAAAEEWPLAADIVDALNAPPDDDGDEAVPVGESRILSDLGVTKKELFGLLDDDDAFAADVLLDIADRLGFGDEFEEIIG